VALKVPHESCLVDEGFRTRFLREGELGQQLHHPNIVRIHDTGEDRGRLYLAMELLEGRTLKQELREVGTLPERRAIEIVRAIAEALDYAHAKGVIHRDLKPENIMVLDGGAIKVMDFGIARVAGQAGLTNTNLFLGTPLYAAPESVDARHVDHRADLYSLGIIFFELLQGTAPFVSESPFRVIEMHMNAPLPSLSSLPNPVRPVVWAMVERLCAKDREARYPGAASLLVDLNRILHDVV
jgi:serine/threonine protein kinase